MKKEKFWTVVNGRIGTAHIGRDGSLKDFREGKIDWRCDLRYCGLRVNPAEGVLIKEKGEFPVVEELLGSEEDWLVRYGDRLPVIAIAVEVNGVRCLIDLPSKARYRSPIVTPNTTAWYASWQKMAEEGKERSRQQWEQDKELRHQRALRFWEEFQSADFSRQELRWLRRFADYGKAEYQVHRLVEDKFPSELVKAFREEHTPNSQTQALRELAKRVTKGEEDEL